MSGHDRRPTAVPVRHGTTHAVHRSCTVAVVSYNSAGDLPGLLDSLKVAAPGVDLRVMVVDNASSDGSADLARSLGVECIDTGANLGYAGAINIALRHAAPDVPFLVLNPDVELAPGSVATLLGSLADPAVGIAVPLLLDADGSVYPSLRREPSVLRALGDACLGRRVPNRPGWSSEMVRDLRRYEAVTDVDWATGAVMLFSAPCHRAVGDWDESFFLYAEEIDVAARARRAGFVVRFEPSAVARHRRGGSGTSPALMALMSVNRVRYFRKQHKGAQAALFQAVVALHELLRSRDPDHRAALRSVVRSSSWSSLPKASAGSGIL